MTHLAFTLLMTGLAAAAASAVAQTPEAERRDAALRHWQAMSPEEKAAAVARLKERSAANMHETLEATVRQANALQDSKRLDAYTTLQRMSYDRSVPVFTYHYTSTQPVDEAVRRASHEHQRKTICASHFAPYMKLHGLKVASRFADASTGRELLVVTVGGKDCPS